MAGRLLAVSDLHVGYPENRAYADSLVPGDPGDWLIVAGDVGETFADVGFVLASLASRFATVIWTPGNHELWTLPSDQVALRGVARYEALLKVCRRFGVLTPEDEFPVWDGPDGPVTIAPLFTLYDYSFPATGAAAAGPGDDGPGDGAPDTMAEPSGAHRGLGGRGGVARTTATRAAGPRRSRRHRPAGSPPRTRDGCTRTRTRRWRRGAETGWRRRSGGSPPSTGPSCSPATGRC